VLVHERDSTLLPTDDPRVADVGPTDSMAGKGRPRRRRKKTAPVVQPADWRGVDPADLSNPALYLNRELSWLEFNQRVLAQAWNPAHPLLERVKFLGISGTNLDEFFMVRLATLLKKYRAGIEDLSPDGLNTEQQLMAIRGRALTMMGSLSRCWNESLRPQLAAEGVHFLDVADFTPAINEYLASFFRTDIFPVLTPLAFDPGHPFPYISNLSKNLAVVVKHGGRTKFARVKVPDMLPRFVPVPENIAPKGGLTFAFLEDVIEHNIHELFPGTEVRGAHLFRIIRDTDMVIQEDEADDLLETVDKGLKQLRYGALSLLG
jgi:polyphosphate kinase